MIYQDQEALELQLAGGWESILNSIAVCLSCCYSLLYTSNFRCCWLFYLSYGWLSKGGSRP